MYVVSERLNEKWLNKKSYLMTDVPLLLINYFAGICSTKLPEFFSKLLSELLALN